MTTAEKLANLNALRAINGKTPLKAWKQSGEKLEQALVAESDEALAKDRAKAEASKGELFPNSEWPEGEGFEPIQKTPAFDEETPKAEEFTEEEIMEKAEENERQEAAKEDTYVDPEFAAAVAERVAKKAANRKKGAEKAKEAKGETIRSFAEHLLKTEPKLKHAEVAEKVRAKFKGSSTSAASVAWYASKLRKKK